MNKNLHFVILILLLNICFLFSPKPKPETNFCGEYIPINTYTGYIRNCDAIGFLESSISPSALMREKTVRQNRPLYVVLASGIGYSIFYLSNLFNTIHGINIEHSMYAAYVFFNFIILLLSIILFEKIVHILSDGKIPYKVVLMLSVFIASNFMDKAFFWTAHQQMLAFLMPLLSIYISIHINKGVSTKWLYSLFFILGVGMLAYGSFLILFFVFLVQLCYIKYNEKRLFTFQTALFITKCWFLFAFSTITWILFLKYNEVEYYNHEVVQYRQLVWMMDQLSISIMAFLSALYINTIDFFKTFTKLYLFIALFGITLIVQRIKKGVFFKWNQNNILILLNLFFFGCFFWVLGYYAYRLTFTLMPIILCLSVANTGDLLKNKKVQIVLLVTVSIWHAINVLSYGPFS